MKIKQKKREIQLINKLKKTDKSNKFFKKKEVKIVKRKQHKIIRFRKEFKVKNDEEQRI